MLSSVSWSENRQAGQVDCRIGVDPTAATGCGVRLLPKGIHRNDDKGFPRWKSQ